MNEVAIPRLKGTALRNALHGGGLLVFHRALCSRSVTISLSVSSNALSTLSPITPHLLPLRSSHLPNLPKPPHRTSRRTPTPPLPLRPLTPYRTDPPPLEESPR